MKRWIAMTLLCAMMIGMMGPVRVTEAAQVIPVNETGISRQTMDYDTSDLETGNSCSNRYLLYSSGEHDTLQEGKYLIVGTHSGGGISNLNEAIGVNASGELNQPSIAEYIQQDQSVLLPDDINCGWTVNETTNGYTFKNGDKYLTITDNNHWEGVVLGNDPYEMTTVVSNTHSTGAWGIGNGTGYLNNRSDNKVGTWTQNDAGSAYRLYIAEDYYIVDGSGLNALIIQLDPGNDYLKTEDYTEESWNTFLSALNEAKAAIEELQPEYTIEEEAKAVKEDLDIKYKALYKTAMELQVDVAVETVGNETRVIAGEEAIPAIVWQRTYETSSYSGNLKMEVPNFTGNDYTKITWDFSQIEDLTTDPKMVVWDYGTPYWITGSGTGIEGLRASTWYEHGSGGWTTSSVRLIRGEFIWPEGYDIDDTLLVESAEDKDYAPIYEFINANPELANAFAGCKVIPVNDDCYIFIRKKDDPLTSVDDDYMNHLIFWTGTTGKGVWSVTDKRDDDWKRIVPATFHGSNALPAFYQVPPNTGFLDGTSAPTLDGDYSSFYKYMVHTDKWYSMADTNACNTVLKNLYPGTDDIVPGDVVCVDMFCFDNSYTGGVDPLEFKLIKREPESTSVTVNYYLRIEGIDTLLGTAYLTNQAYGSSVTLKEGTNTAQLNYRKNMAQTMLSNSDEPDQRKLVVGDGEQLNAPLIVSTNEAENVIKVVYTTGWPRTYYTYDFGVTNRYEHVPKLGVGYTVTSIELSGNRHNLTASIANAGGTDNEPVLEIEYTPTDALGEYITETLGIHFQAPGETDPGYIEETIYIYPASNVLYEENFVEAGSSGSGAPQWGTVGTVDASEVSDNGYVKYYSATEPIISQNKTVYGYTSSYLNSQNDSCSYKTTVSSEAKMSEPMTFTFNGTGFDLIGTCGPETGTLIGRVTDGSNSYAASFLVDTAYTDENYGTIHQVPIVHISNLPMGNYTITVWGYYLDYSKVSQTRMGGRNGTMEQIYEACHELGFTDKEIESTQFIGIDRHLAPSTYNGVRSGALRAQTPSKMTLEVDCFRVYRYSSNTKYFPDEFGMTYTNVMDCTNGKILAYVENDQEHSVEILNYEQAGGPENEIYLAPGQAVAIKLANVSINKAHVSARWVGGTGSTQNSSVKMTVKTQNGTSEKVIAHNTEMYYEVAAVNGVVVIGNTSDAGGSLLALGNVKASDGIAEISEATLASAANAVLMMMRPSGVEQPEETEPEETEPEETEPEETEPEETEPEETEPEETEPEETEPEETKPEEEEPFDPEQVELPFEDVEKDSWYAEAVAYVYHYGLMNGTSDNTFDPQAPMTRAMVATVLHRLAGSPEPESSGNFEDVAENDWFAKAVTWAAENKIVNGVGNGKFAPGMDVTREQLATMLYRFCQFSGYDLSNSKPLTGFPDAGTVSSWAVEAMEWAFGNGILTGTQTNDGVLLAPQANALRAQIAVILQRFCQLHR